MLANFVKDFHFCDIYYLFFYHHYLNVSFIKAAASPGPRIVLDIQWTLNIYLIKEISLQNLGNLFSYHFLHLIHSQFRIAVTNPQNILGAAIEGNECRQRDVMRTQQEQLGNLKVQEKRRELPQFGDSRCKNKRKNIYFYMCKQS